MVSFFILMQLYGCKKSVYASDFFKKYLSVWTVTSAYIKYVGFQYTINGFQHIRVGFQHRIYTFWFTYRHDLIEVSMKSWNLKY